MSDQSTDETQADTSDLEKQAAEALASAVSTGAERIADR